MLWVPCTVCPCWGGPDVSLWLPWVCCWCSLLGCLRHGWYLTSWLGKGGGEYFVCFDDDEPQCLTVGPRENGWFVQHDISSTWNVCFVSSVSFA